MPAARLSSALIRRVALGVAGTGAAAVIEDVRHGLRVTIVANPANLALPLLDNGGDEAERSCDEAFGVQP